MKPRRGDPTKPRRGAFDIAIRDGGRETVTGYVAGDFGMRKERWFWEFTHLPTGVKLTTYPTHETLQSALAHLEHLARHGPPEYQAATLSRGTWGLLEDARCRVGEYAQGRNSISFVHLDTGLEIILVSGKKRQAVVRDAIRDAGTCDFAELRRIAYAARPAR